MPRLRLTIAYVGTHYHGWQIQARKDGEEPPTVQAFVEKAVSHVAGRPTHVQGAGRTDSGVHAEAQTAHCDIPEERSHVRWKLALNTLLPHDIRVLDARLAPDSFDACRSVFRKQYTYSLWLDQFCTPPRLYPFVWACGPLDLKRLDAAIPHLTGVHDFASMQNAGTPHKSTVRTLFSIRRRSGNVLQNDGDCGGSVADVLAGLQEDRKRLDLVFEADGFLKQMVRNLTGLLAACGRGDFDPDDIPALLESRDRRRAPFTAPPQGLTMSSIWYKDEPMPPGWEK
ncbi:MAG: tRNA pseudouridine(38-40) synthase TruA [Mailhella sp.]|nr:tRNA pseudouridine(38-40) synthase TruA [Mailhella sp.]